MRGPLVLATSLAPLVLTTACKPPATEEMATGEEPRQITMPSTPLDSPDTTGAFWAQSPEQDRLMYGMPGERALFALTCVEGTEEDGKRIEYERLATADAEAKAVLSLIGNSHVTRIHIDAAERREGDWIWRGSVPADSPDLEVLTGAREVEATIPGAGTIVFNPSTAPGAFIAQCRGLAAPVLEGAIEAELLPTSVEDQPEAPE
ncbi:hypothetical protein ACRAQ7_10040 [Erythrobacter sp. W53]|uniref:hypothetical protein n=1 Tax=Erythrobacter sp. W53 TaxID=3425947 RepID=UPI003D767335